MLFRSQPAVTVSEIEKPLPGISAFEVSMAVPSDVVRLLSNPSIVWVKLKVPSPPVVFLMSLIVPGMIVFVIVQMMAVSAAGTVTPLGSDVQLVQLSKAVGVMSQLPAPCAEHTTLNEQWIDESSEHLPTVSTQAMAVARSPNLP